MFLTAKRTLPCLMPLLLTLCANTALAADPNQKVNLCHYEDNISKASKDAAEQILKRDKNSLAAWLCVGRWQQEQKQYPAALQSLKKAEQLSLKQDEKELNLIQRYIKNTLAELPAQGYRDDYNYYNTVVARADRQNVAAIGRCNEELKAESYAAAIEALALQWLRNTHLSEANLCLGRAFFETGNFTAALGVFLMLERLPSGEKNGRALAWNWLAMTHKHLGNLDAALDYGNKALSEWRRLGSRGMEATELNNIAIIYGKKGDKRRAITYNEQSLALRDKDEDKAATWNNLAVIYSEEGDTAKAIDLMQRALNAHRRAGNKLDVATGELNLGGLYSDSGNFEQAEKLLNSGLAGVQQLGATNWEITGHQYLAWLRKSQGKMDEYRDYLNKALALATEAGNQPKIEAISKEIKKAGGST